MDYLEIASQEDVFSSYAAEEGGKEHNHEMNLAWRFVSNTNMSVFLTGKAGTGKTTFLRTLRERTPKTAGGAGTYGCGGHQCAGTDHPLVLPTFAGTTSARGGAGREEVALQDEQGQEEPHQDARPAGDR